MWAGWRWQWQPDGGASETSLYGVLLWLCFSGYWVWLQFGSEMQPLRRALLQLGMAGLLGLGVAAIQWLPVVDALWQSETLSAVSQAALTWQSIFFQWREWLAALTMLMPDFFGNPRHHTYSYPYDNYNEQTLFAGVLPLALAFLVFLKGQGLRGAGQGKSAASCFQMATAATKADSASFNSPSR